MRYDNLEERYDHTIKAGCWGCFIYILLFFGAGGVILFFELPIILSVPSIGVFVLIWAYFFVKARKKDQKKDDFEI